MNIDATKSYRVVNQRTGQLWSAAYGWVWPGTAQEKEATLYSAEDVRRQTLPVPEGAMPDAMWQFKPD